MRDREELLSQLAEHGPIVLGAPAKLNLDLKIVGVRSDGYHFLESEMVAVDLFDTLELSPGDGISLKLLNEIEPGEIPVDNQNLISRALEAVGVTAHVKLTKAIAVCAGLGGGSSDGAAILRWAGMFDPETASKIGFDLPFFLTGGRSQVSGAGEVVQPLPFEPKTFTLLMTPVKCETAAVFAHWDKLNIGPNLKSKPSSNPNPSLSPGPESEARNDLKDAAFDLYPELSQWYDKFAELTGAQPQMSGSGSTLFVEGSFKGRLSGAQIVICKSLPAFA